MNAANYCRVSIVSTLLTLVGCASPPPPTPKPVQIQYDRCGHNTRNPMGLPADIALNASMSDPAGYAHMIEDFYAANPQCLL
jgi:hypothetical protein